MRQVVGDFEVINCSLEAKGDNMKLELHFKRLNLSFWMAIFLPSICLIAAAEITLFVNKEHFEATIMVALTSNLVMYTLYNGVQNDLPKDPQLKIIDVWFVHSLLMPMVVISRTIGADEMVRHDHTRQ